ncbi:aldose 1-epimerase [Salinibacillus kushneri]|uniref:Aldose 1-epimerase n=1 Tax=Salinibacillus kushneri TaxID=237682 RepID=A0A1I0EMU7_9BACI|nr:aldose epimerase family protein [Salinibacillus kushneri]SET46722.1 aldose 1-epimerase [Salinibacillus kushneri]
MEIYTNRVAENWTSYILKNDFGMEVHVLNYGGIITKILVPDREGNLENVVLGYKNVKDYEKDTNFLGAVIGRVAGRIKHAGFELNGQSYDLEANDGPHHLHGGSYGLNQVVWDSELFEEEGGAGVKLHHMSKDGEGGYPGEVQIELFYTLTNNNEFIIDYRANTNHTTPLTLTNHSYFNLSGNLKETIENHQVRMDSHHFLELDEDLIPTGTILDVENTPFDFRSGRKLKDGMSSTHPQNDIAGNGYDHYYIYDKGLAQKVKVKDEQSGRVLSIQTDQPGMVMYTSNNLAEGLQLAEGTSKKHLGVCFETQASPASLHETGLPSVLLHPHQNYEKRTVFQFGLDK